MQLPPGRSLLDGRCVKDTPPAALDCMAKWTAVHTSFLWFFISTAPKVLVQALSCHDARAPWGLCDVMLSCRVYLLSMTHVVGVGSS